MNEYNLTSPLLTLRWDGRPDYWPIIVGVWFVAWAVFGITAIYAYAVPFRNAVGFETALLVGIALIVVGVNVDE